MNILYAILTASIRDSRTKYCTDTYTTQTVRNVVNKLLSTYADDQAKQQAARLICAVIIYSPYYIWIQSIDPQNSYTCQCPVQVALPPYNVLVAAAKELEEMQEYTQGNYIQLLTSICHAILKEATDNNVA